MKAVIQQVTEASVSIDGMVHSAIGTGMLILFCVEVDDTDSDLEWMLKKTLNLRIFDDGNGVMNRNILDAGGEILVVSQFTLAANVRKGNRPSYINAARPEKAIPIYERFCRGLEEELKKNAESCGPEVHSYDRNGTVPKVQTGVFGADMKVALINDGPVTILLDSYLK